VTKDILLPDLGEGIDLVDVSEVLIKIGDSVAADDPVIVLESDKATMEVPTTEGGIVSKVYVKNGDQIRAGQPIVAIDIKAGDKPQKPSSAPEEQPAEQKAVKEVAALVTPIAKHDREKTVQVDIQTATKSPLQTLAPASPGVRRFARELGVTLSFVLGSGKKGRIVKEDVQEYVKEQLAAKVKPAVPQLPTVDFSQWGSIEKVALNRIRRITGERMQISWQTVPHVTQFDKADITELEAYRKSLQKGKSTDQVKVTILPFLMKAVTQLLIEFPDFNSSLDSNSNDLIQKKYYNIGVAVDTPGGLVVPVIKNVDKKNIMILSEELIDVSTRARNRKINPDELVGGTFTISSLGSISGTYFTPIINLPEVAILGVSRAVKEPVYINEKIKTRFMLPYALSYDHRVIDGAEAARFTKRLNEILTNYNQIPGIK
jgi:pyruvate dehydrogenase E2 component (dihydrolipoamide acetyltransferase)